MPSYLADIKKHQTFIEKSFETVNPEDLKEEQRIEKERAALQKARDQR